MITLSPAEAEYRRLVDEASRIETPAAFAQNATEGKWLFPPHLQIIDREISRAVNGETPYRIVLIDAPPRHGKSEYVSHWLPSWYLGIWPRRHVLLGSYSDSFARLWGRRSRDTLVRHGRRYFGVRVSNAKTAANEWILSAGGSMVSTGAGGSLTGRGANLLIIDDTTKNAEEAMSESRRDAQWDWWQSTAWSRLTPGGVAVVLQTRWHPDDVFGRILKWADEKEIPHVHLHFPAICDDPEDDLLGRDLGEALWPELWPVEELEIHRGDDYWFSSLYQGRPGQYGQSEWPDEYFEGIWTDETGETWPDAWLGTAIACDPSKGKNAKKGDYSANVFVGLARGLLWVDADIARRPVTRLAADGVRFAQKHGCDAFGIETNAFQELLIGPFEEAADDAEIPPLPIYQINNQVNKVVRISRLGAWLGRGKLRFRRNKSTELLVDQLKGFPFADHDDGPDALEMAIRLLRWLLGDPSTPEQMTEAKA